MGRFIESESNLPPTNLEQNTDQLMTRMDLRNGIQERFQKIRSRLQEIEGKDMYSSDTQHVGGMKFDRRGFLLWAGKRTGEVIMLGTVLAAAPELLKVDVVKKQLEVHKESSEKFEKTGELQVSGFASEIMQTSNTISDNTSDFSKVTALTGALAANIGIAFLLRKNPNKANRIGGAISFNGGALVDGISTLAFTKYMQDPRFVEYGFDGYIYEKALVIPSNPTQNDIVKAHVARALVMTPLSFIVYPLGRMYLGMSPEIIRHNFALAHTLKTGFDLGDQVKDL